MYGSTGSSKPQHETTVTSGIIWIVLQQFAGHDALLNLFDEDMLALTLMLGVERELVVIYSNLLANVLKGVHALPIVYRSGQFVQSGADAGCISVWERTLPQVLTAQ